MFDDENPFVRDLAILLGNGQRGLVNAAGNYFFDIGSAGAEALRDPGVAVRSFSDKPSAEAFNQARDQRRAYLPELKSDPLTQAAAGRMFEPVQQVAAKLAERYPSQAYALGQVISDPRFQAGSSIVEAFAPMAGRYAQAAKADIFAPDKPSVPESMFAGAIAGADTAPVSSFIPMEEAARRAAQYGVKETSDNIDKWLPDAEKIASRKDIGPLEKSIQINALTGGKMDYMPKGKGKWELVYVTDDNTWIQGVGIAAADDWSAPHQDPDTPLTNNRKIKIGDRAKEESDPFIKQGAENTEQFQLFPEMLDWRLGPTDNILDPNTNGYANMTTQSIFLNRDANLGDNRWMQPYGVDNLVNGGALPMREQSRLQGLLAHEVQHGISAYSGRASGSSPDYYMDAPYSERATRDKIYNIFDTLGPGGAKAALDDMLKNTKADNPEFDHIYLAADIAKDAMNDGLPKRGAHDYSIMMGGPDAEYVADLGEVGARAAERQLAGGSILGNSLIELARAQEYIPEGLSPQGIQYLRGRGMFGSSVSNDAPRSMFDQPSSMTGTLRSRRPEEPEGSYDPRYVDAEEQIIYGDDDKTPLAVSDIPRLKNPEEATIPEPSWPPEDWKRPDMFERMADPSLPSSPPEPEFIYRAMSADEYDAFKKNGYIQSNGSYNIGDEQKGLTYFTKSPESAVSYANGFAPKGHTPGADRPAYIVKIKNVGPDRQRIVRGTAEHEVGVTGRVPSSEVAGVYRGDVVANIPATPWRNERNVLRWTSEPK